MFIPDLPMSYAVTPEGELVDLDPEKLGERWRVTDGRSWWSCAPLQPGPGVEDEEEE